MASSQDSIYERLHFESRPDVAETLVELALSFVSDHRQPRLLDLGCGTGAVSITALTRRSDLTAVALDISPANVVSTRAAAAKPGVSDRLTIVCADYMRWQGGSFDLIVSDSVLQLIEARDIDLIRRLAADLLPNGHLVATMPFDCWANSVRILLRRMWRGLPPATDRWVAVMAQRLYSEFSSEFLAERLSYLRITPVRLLNEQLLAEFHRHGLRLVKQSLWPSPSAAKLDHKLLVWKKR
ncbi:MAG: hypothetical protein C5B56_06265 [Proteobacteria bacterium]|nr:MAG: hypothetical protein C5B56_06265 [Pseudomonadota bacterium]